MSKKNKKTNVQVNENGEEIIVETEKKDNVFKKIGHSVGTAYGKVSNAVKQNSKTIKRVGVGIGIAVGAAYGAMKVLNSVNDCSDEDETYEDSMDSCELEPEEDLSSEQTETEA